MPDPINGQTLFFDDTLAPGVPIRWGDTLIGKVQRNGVNIGSRAAINFIEGANVTIGVVDNPGLDRIDVTVGLAGGVPNPQVDSTTEYEYNLDMSINRIVRSVGGSPVETSVFAYNQDGSISTISTSYVGSSKVDTFAYLPDGSIDTITTEWA